MTVSRLYAFDDAVDVSVVAIDFGDLWIIFCWFTDTANVLDVRIVHSF